MVYCRFKKW